MSYSTSNPPSLVTQRVGSGPAIWMYKSADPVATVLPAGYITNAGDLGMLVGDVVFIVNTTSSLTSVATVASITSGAADLAALTAAST